jgi:polyphosphate kinase 2 (PPK2 family)
MRRWGPRTIACWLVWAGGVGGAITAHAAPKPPRVARTELPDFVHEGAVARARAWDRRIERYRQKLLSRDLGLALRRSPDRRPWLVILEGPDGAGKTAFIEDLRNRVGDARKVLDEHVPTPSPNAAEHERRVKESFSQLPAEGEIMVLDRSDVSRAVYDRSNGRISKKVARATLNHFADKVAELRSQGVRVTQVFLDVSSRKQAKVIAEREAYANEKLDGKDYLSHREFKRVRRLFKRATARTGEWKRVNMDHRPQGRRRIMKFLLEQLKGAEAAP